MSDEPFRFAINPIVADANARLLINTLAQSFPNGARSEDLRIRFEEVTGLKRQMYYDTLSYCKYRRWIVGGGKGAVYSLNSDGSWKPPKTATGEILERDRLEHVVDTQAVQIEELRGQVDDLRDWSSGSDANGVAVSSLIKIVTDNSASVRQKLRASAAILGYRVHDDGVVEFVKGFLGSVCASTDTAVDYKVEAAELLRKHEAPKIGSEIVRPSYRAEPEGSEAQRVEAWRSYLIFQRKWKLIMDSQPTRLEPDAPYRLPPGWIDEFYAADWTPPPSGWPPQAAVVGPDAIRLHVEKSELMRRARRGNGNGNGSDKPSSLIENKRT